MKIVLRYIPRTITGWLTPKRFLKCDAAELCLWGIKLEEVTIIGMRCAVCSLDEWLRSWKMALLILLHRSTLLFPFRFTEKHGIMVSGPTSFKYSIANSSYMTYAQKNKVLLLFRLMYGNPGQSWILDSTPRIPNSWYWIPVLSVEFGYWIPIVNGYLESLSCSPDYKAPDSDSISKIYPDSGIRTPLHGANYSLQTELFLYRPPVKQSEIWVTCASSSLDFPRIRSLMNFFCCISVQFLNLGRGFVVSMTKLSSLSASVIHMQYIIFAVNMHSARTRP